MATDDATRLNTLGQLVYQKTGHSLTNLQRLILRECWQPSKKTYGKIAASNNYSSRYIKQRVAPELWHLMSEVVGEKVTKSNCRSTLFRYLEDAKAPLSDEGQSLPPQASSQAELKVSETASNRLLSEPSNTQDVAPQPASISHLLEFPTASVPIGSPYYIKRDPHEESCYQLIECPGVLIRIKAPEQMGKTSLMNRIVAQVPAYSSVVLNFQQVENDILGNLDRLMRWLCANVARQLDIPSGIGEFWDGEIGSKMSCTLYIEEYILDRIDTPVVLALEESNELFDYEEISQEFFGMLRTWYEYTKHHDTWRKLRIILVQSTEAYVALNVNQSPFNVGFEVALSPFTGEQVSLLAKQSGVALDASALDRLMVLLQGHPYLVRLALYHLAKGGTDWVELFAIAPTDEGIFSYHLHRHLWKLQQYPELLTAMERVIQSAEPVQIGQEQAFKLHSMGLVTLEKNRVRVSCELYRQYFSARLPTIDLGD